MADKKMDNLPDRIEQTFRGQNILITGGTGFLGKVMLEKFLRCLPGITQIFMLVRPKKGKEPKDRLDEIFQGPVFDQIREQKGLGILHNRVTAIKGDVMLPELGISAEDKKMLIDKITIIYHAAATVRFDEALKKAVLLNTRGTKQMLELAKEMKNLLFFGHISTSYCHLDQKLLEEKLYPPPADPHKVIQCIEWMDDEIVDIITDKILGKIPNTYAFTKALSEGIIEEAMPHIPVVLLRPSVVVPIWKEPLPGWTDNINGPTGLLIGAGKGVIRSMYCNENSYADYVPVDILVNAILACTWNYIYFKDHDKRIYNLTSSSDFKVSWAEIIEIGRRVIEKIPLNGVLWYPGGSMKRSRLHHDICVFLFHTIPAYFIDTIIFLAGYEPIMCRVQRRIQKGFDVFEYYANNQWDFINANIKEVRDKLNAREYNKYYMHGDDIDVYKYFETCVQAARIYILKELPETLPAARRHIRIMYWVDIFTKILFFALLIYVLFSWMDSFETLFEGSWTGVTKILSL
ncbi:hypothetical protein HZH66_003682 [Vespula vulgaris]|uniref:Fatty acyl-CoA reductase n=2 Tax=Vespula vulgaris TaxID=7454 RepID=A0A834KIP6_VESVU|nr:putative fatty acyl-CoA reductase CG5065 isoform X1 [Vespula vulgaris]KAF7404776.1 hypothetical protein HZH66_003682 [Vespula vulgaris]